MHRFSKVFQSKGTEVRPLAVCLPTFSAVCWAFRCSAFCPRVGFAPTFSGTANGDFDHQTSGTLPPSWCRCGFDPPLFFTLIGTWSSGIFFDRLGGPQQHASSPLVALSTFLIASGWYIPPPPPELNRGSNQARSPVTCTPFYWPFLGLSH